MGKKKKENMRWNPPKQTNKQKTTTTKITVSPHYKIKLNFLSMSYVLEKFHLVLQIYGPPFSHALYLGRLTPYRLHEYFLVILVFWLPAGFGQCKALERDWREY